MGSRRWGSGLPAATRRATALLAVLLAGPTPLQAAFQNDFSAYPEGAWSCLNSASEASNCDGTTVTAMNACLCSNGGGFVLSAAACIGGEDAADLSSVYSTMSAACDYTNTPLTVSQDEFKEAAAGDSSATTTTTSSSSTTAKKTTTSTSSSTTTTTTSSSTSSTTTTTSSTSTSSTTTTTGTSTKAHPSQTGSGTSGHGTGLSQSARIGILAGAIVAVIAIIGATICCVVRHRRRRQASEESHPMLSQDPTFFGGPGGVGGGGAGARGSVGTELTRFSGISEVGGSQATTAASAFGTPEAAAKWQHLASTSPGPYLADWPAGAGPTQDSLSLSPQQQQQQQFQLFQQQQQQQHFAAMPFNPHAGAPQNTAHTLYQPPPPIGGSGVFELAGQPPQQLLQPLAPVAEMPATPMATHADMATGRPAAGGGGGGYEPPHTPHIGGGGSSDSTTMPTWGPPGGGYRQ